MERIEKGLRHTAAVITLLFTNIIAFGQGLYTLSNLEPLITPPESAMTENWQLCCRNWLSDYPVYTDDVKVAIDGEDIYVGNLMGDFPITDPIIWIKGKIKGNKVEFSNGQEVCKVDAKYVRDEEPTSYTYRFYTTDCASVWESHEPIHGHDSGHYLRTLTFREDAWILDYDSDHKIMSGSNFPCVFSPRTVTEEFINASRNPYNGRIINEVIMGKVDENACQPTKPQRFIFTGDMRTILRIYAQPKSPEGMMLDPQKLHYQVIMDGDIYARGITDKENWKGYTYAEQAFYCDMGVPTTMDFEECYARMAYVDGDDIYYSDILYLGQSDMTDINPDVTYDMDSEIYDLMGRKCNAEFLSPGIYIRNGKKFVVARR